MLSKNDCKKIKSYYLTEKQEQSVILAWESVANIRINKFLVFILSNIESLLILLLVGSYFEIHSILPAFESFLVFYIWLVLIIIGPSSIIIVTINTIFNSKKNDVVLSRINLNTWNQSKSRKMYKLIIKLVMASTLAIGSYIVTAIFLCLATICVIICVKVTKQMVQDRLNLIEKD